MAADGSIIIDTRIQTEGLSKGLNTIKAGMTRITAQVSKMGETAKNSFQRQIATVNSLYQSYEKQERKVAELKSKLDELGKSKIETEEYKQISDQIKALETDFEKIESKQREWIDMGFPVDSGPVKELDKQLDEIWADMGRLQNKQKEMQVSGSAYIDPKSTDAYKNTLQKYDEESQKLERINGRLYSSYNNLKKKVEEYQEKNNKLVLAMQNLQKAAARVGAVMKNIGSALKSAGSAVKSMVSAMKKAVESMLNFDKQTKRSKAGLGKMLGMSLLFSGMFRAINAVGDGVKTGIQNLAKYSNTANTAMSSLMSSMTRLKNSFATAFAPILTTVAPILVKFINLMSDAVTRVGMLIAALTGQKTFTKAIGVQEDYAASLDKTADSAKKAAKEVKGYLSPIDELNRYDDGVNSAGTIGGNKYTDPSAGDMFEEVPITSSIKGIADKIRKLIKKEDWEGLGAYIASGINKGLQKIYDVINWNNVGPKITKFCDAFTRTFNSLVDHIDWDLLGRTVGAGINTLVNTLNLLITGINWKNLGKKFAEGITGLVHEVNWNNLGQLLGNMFMISWKVFSGFVHNLPYADIGKAVADALNGVFSTVSFSEIGDTLATGLNGAFTTLYNFAVNFNWKQMVDNIAGGINTFVSKFDWKGNGQKLEIFLNNLCTSLVGLAQKTNWEEVGKGIGTFLSQIDWGKHLWQVIEAIKTTIGGLFDGLEEGGTAGKIAAFLGKAFIAVKIADITGIGSLVKLLIGAIGKKIIGSEAVAALSGSLTSVLGKAASAAAGGFTSLASSLAPLVGTAGLIAAVATAAIVGTEKLAGFIETLQGGNGVLTQAGGYLHDYAGAMSSSNVITQKQAEDLWKLIEADESAGKSNAEMYDSFIHKLAEYGISAEQAKAILEQYGAQAGVTGTFVEDMTNKVLALGQGFSESAGQIDLSSLSAKEAISVLSDTLYTLSLKGNEFSGTYQGVRSQLQDTGGSAKSAQDALNMVYTALKNAGVPLDDLNAALGAEFPAATTAVTTAVDTNIVGAQEKISSSMETAKTDVENATSSMASDTKTNTESVKRDTDDSFKEVTKTSKSEWKESYGAVKDALEDMQRDTLEAMKNIMGYIQSYWESVVIDTNLTWETMSRKVDKELSNMAGSADIYGKQMADNLVRAIGGAETSIIRSLNNIISRVNGMVGNINNSIAGIESGFTFSYNVQLPNGGRRFGNYHLTLPRVNTVPYLASGAVIPPRSEFLAVLGDQKKGNNLETPESLLRQIVREESGKGQGDGNTYNVTVNASGRKLLDIIISEAEMRRRRNGKNPFELA
ncbi:MULTISPECIES: hypothetical protein [Blautia]|nr:MULTISPECIES: hypothetical protein [Blautia]RHQ37323.1 hypothetical protein DWY50_07345 [Ruminococcus sp. AF25-28AC]MCB5686970.1 hypothetical protein [Blautia wexlerae]NSD01515.1 hypothetical protein [Blautia wexlerae]NSE92825.1 hypothetical protein [Blautia wexlerae]NSF14424.1 hypothetical protein [Blautia wexlerae]